MSSKKFNQAVNANKPHVHRCPKCYANVPCSAINCPHAEWTECADCCEGWQYVMVEGSLVKRKEIPGRVRVDPMFPKEER